MIAEGWWRQIRSFNPPAHSQLQTKVHRALWLQFSHAGPLRAWKFHLAFLCLCTAEHLKSYFAALNRIVMLSSMTTLSTLLLLSRLVLSLVYQSELSLERKGHVRVYFCACAGFTLESVPPTVIHNTILIPSRNMITLGLRYLLCLFNDYHLSENEET